MGDDVHTLTHAAAKLLLLVKLPSLYKYIRFQRAIRAKSRRYMEESEGERGREGGKGLEYYIWLTSRSRAAAPPCMVAHILRFIPKKSFALLIG